MTSPINIFIAYAREDASYQQELRKHLRILERNNNIKIWYDGEILPGQKWNEEIEAQLERADIFLMLLSADFINSDYAYTKEMRQALERHERGEAIVIPIIARACSWQLTPLAELQAPVAGKPLGNATAGASRDQLYADIVLAINKAVQQRQTEKDKHQRYFADEAAWKNALQLNSINSFNRYLEQHPNGRHAAEAGTAIADIQRQQAQDKNDIERRAWQQAQDLNTEAAYRDYLQKYPNGQFVANANRAIQFIQQDRDKQTNQADRQAFEKAKAENTLDAYRRYLIQFPNGAHTKDAERARQRLEQPVLQNDNKKIIPYLQNDNKKIIPYLLAILLAGTGMWGISKLVAPPPTTTGDSTELNLPTETVSTPNFTVEDLILINYLDTTMIAVKGGTFKMGCTSEQQDCQDREKPVHPVTLSDFYIGKYEVTVKEFATFVAATNYQTNADKGDGSYIWTGSEWKLTKGVNWKYDVKGSVRDASEYDHPVIHVSWNDAMAYCAWLSEKIGKTYRLPTEAEWEYAAREGGKAVLFGNGENILYPAQANFDARADYKKPYSVVGTYREKTTSVGTFAPNALGLYDMAGNVWEWCSDWYGSDYYKNSSQNNPTGATTGTYRVLRGGSWNGYPQGCRVAVRNNGTPSNRYDNIGFRLARTR